jgi:hypothetical protein
VSCCWKNCGKIVIGRLTHPNVHRKIVVLFDHILLMDEELIHNLGVYLNKNATKEEYYFSVNT